MKVFSHSPIPYSSLFAVAVTNIIISGFCGGKWADKPILVALVALQNLVKDAAADNDRCKVRTTRPKWYFLTGQYPRWLD